MKKQIDPNETYEVKEMFSCGEGHFMTPGFTHWEEGEACPYDHNPNASNADVHLYYRKILVPTLDSNGRNMWEELTKPENAGKWGHLPVAP